MLAGTSLSLDAAAKLGRDIASRMNGRGTVNDVARALCTRLLPTLLAPDHLGALLDLALSEASSGVEKEEGRFLAAVFDLLVDTATAAPSLFTTCADKVRCPGKD